MGKNEKGLEKLNDQTTSEYFRSMMSPIAYVTYFIQVYSTTTTLVYITYVIYVF